MTDSLVQTSPNRRLSVVSGTSIRAVPPAQEAGHSIDLGLIVRLLSSGSRLRDESPNHATNRRRGNRNRERLGLWCNVDSREDAPAREETRDQTTANSFNCLESHRSIFELMSMNLIAFSHRQNSLRRRREDFTVRGKILGGGKWSRVALLHDGNLMVSHRRAMRHQRIRRSNLNFLAPSPSYPLIHRTASSQLAGRFQRLPSPHTSARCPTWTEDMALPSARSTTAMRPPKQAIFRIGSCAAYGHLVPRKSTRRIPSLPISTHSYPKNPIRGNFIVGQT